MTARIGKDETAAVSSLLVHKAHEMIGGLRLKPKMCRRRFLLSPNEIATKNDQEMGREDAEMDLVLILDGIGASQLAKRSVKEFRASWSRPKWRIVFPNKDR